MKKNSLATILILAPFFIFSQSLSLSPSSGPRGENLDVTITGVNTNFDAAGGTTVEFKFYSGSSTSTNSVTIINGSTLVANVYVPNNISGGDYSVSITNSIDGTVLLNNGFHVPPPPPPPSIFSISPSSASPNQTLDVTITGKNTTFTTLQSPVGARFYYFSGGSSTLVCNSTTIINDTVAIVNTTIPPIIIKGSHYIEILVGNGSASSAYARGGSFYIDGVDPPTLVSVSPASANAGQSVSLTIIGKTTHFTNAGGTTASFSFGGSNTVNIINDTTLQVNITIPAQTYTGDYNIHINSSFDGNLSLNKSFHVSGLELPSISVSPNRGKAGETLDVTITGLGTEFSIYAGSNTNIGNYCSFNSAQATLNSSSIVNDSTILANFTISSAAPTSLNLLLYVDYTAPKTNSKLSTRFFIYDNCFSYYKTEYDKTSNLFTLRLDSVTTEPGSSFYWDFGDGATSSDETPSHTFSTDSIFNVCLKVTTALGDTCSYCHKVGKNTYGETVRASGFGLTVERYDGTTGVNELKGGSENSSFNVYPNPGKDVITIKQLANSSNPTISIYSVNGELLIQKEPIKSTTEINIGSFAKGVYFVEITSEDKTEVIKLVKE